MLESYRSWLEAKQYDAGTIATQIYRVERIEGKYGSFDIAWEADRFAALLAEFSYSTADARQHRANPTRLAFRDGSDVRSVLSSYATSIRMYGRFRTELASEEPSVMPEPIAAATSTQSPEPEAGDRIGLERDLQAALRLRPEQIEPGLTIIDSGGERYVDSGRIDITAADAAGTIVVIELKTGIAGQRAVAQILSYMGDIAEEEPDRQVRGLLIASEFDAKAKAAARVVPSLKLMTYAVQFTIREA